MHHICFIINRHIKKMKESVDFIKIKDYAVLNINNMFPVPNDGYTYVDISKEKDPHYKALLQAEYRIIKAQQNRICKNADIVYKHKLSNANNTPLAKRCNDFLQLENACLKYK